MGQCQGGSCGGIAALQQGCARAALPAPPDKKHLLGGSHRLEASPPRSSGEYLEPQRREVTCVPCLCTDPLSQASPWLAAGCRAALTGCQDRPTIPPEHPT